MRIPSGRWSARALPIFNLVLMLYFFRQVPRELEKPPHDGAGHIRTLLQIICPFPACHRTITLVLHREPLERLV